ncbi:MAG: TatD family hydrolase [Candidatus Nanoarchaeia archaeon]
MIYTDVHAHLDFPEYEKDLNQVLEDCKARGVKAIIVNGVHPESNRRILELAEKHPLIKPALGFYPTHIVENKWEAVEKELDFILHNKHKVAIGEVGLDYKEEIKTHHTLEEQKKIQKKAFERIIEISEKTKKPLIIHSRKAEQEVIEMIESSTLKNPVFHCFMGKRKLMQRISDNKWNFSVPVIAIRLQQLQELIEYTNINQLLTETDSPLLGPVPGERNTPANVALTVKKIAEIKGFDEEETSKTIFMNYQRLFL